VGGTQEDDSEDIAETMEHRKIVKVKRLAAKM